MQVLQRSRGLQGAWLDATVAKLNWNEKRMSVTYSETVPVHKEKLSSRVSLLVQGSGENKTRCQAKENEEHREIVSRLRVRPCPPTIRAVGATEGTHIEVKGKHGRWEGLVLEGMSIGKGKVTVFMPLVGYKLQIDAAKLLIALEWDPFSLEWLHRAPLEPTDFNKVIQEACHRHSSRPQKKAPALTLLLDIDESPKGMTMESFLPTPMLIPGPSQPIGARCPSEKEHAINSSKCHTSTHFEPLTGQRETVDVATSPIQVGKSKGKGRRRFTGSFGNQHRVSRLSTLLDAGLLKEGEIVQYRHKDGTVLLEGEICLTGIKCYHCMNVVGMTAFENHAGCKLHRPTHFIFKEDNTSLAACFKLLECGNVVPNPDTIDPSDDLCRVCGEGGELLCCESCPSTFHLSCLGLDKVPEGDWHCPACRCHLCDQSHFATSEEFCDNTVLYCDQCDREFHVSCLGKDWGKGHTIQHLKRRPEGDWFCSEECKRTNQALTEMVTVKPVPLNDTFSWTFMKGSSEHAHKYNMKALRVMEECFHPIRDARTDTDLIPLMIRSERIPGFDYTGFYTMLLHVGNQIGAVALVRVLGCELAEVPLIATRHAYRRKGLCTYLMHVLETSLSQVGVRKLVLPAVDSAVWCSHFSFEICELADLQHLCALGTIVFPGTTWLKKHLIPGSISTEAPSLSKELREELLSIRVRKDGTVRPVKKRKATSAMKAGGSRSNGTKTTCAKAKDSPDSVVEITEQSTKIYTMTTRSSRVIRASKQFIDGMMSLTRIRSPAKAQPKFVAPEADEGNVPSSCPQGVSHAQKEVLEGVEEAPQKRRKTCTVRESVSKANNSMCGKLFSDPVVQLAWAEAKAARTLANKVDFL